MSNFPSTGFATWHLIAPETHKRKPNFVSKGASTWVKRRSVLPCFGVCYTGIVSVGMGEVKSVINGTEQRWASRTKVHEYIDFIELHV